MGKLRATILYSSGLDKRQKKQFLKKQSTEEIFLKVIIGTVITFFYLQGPLATTIWKRKLNCGWIIIMKSIAGKQEGKIVDAVAT